MRYLCLILFAFSSSVIVYGQNEQAVIIELKPLWQNSIFELNKSYYHSSVKDSVHIEILKFYLSNVQLLNNNKVVYSETNSYHLIDFSDSASQKINLPLANKIKFNSIRFNLGIDSTTNISGAMPGDLDPTKGMYWAWQSGYINLKLEGKSPACKTKSKLFEFHLGGYLFPNNSLQTINLKTENKNNLKIVLQVEKLFEKVDLTTSSQIMSPSLKSVELSKYIATLFTIK